MKIHPSHEKFSPKSRIECIDAFIDPPNQQDYLLCPKCNLRPKTWVFDNGRSTACGCWDNQYQHWRVYAESIGSIYKRTKMTAEYSSEDLLNNWNHYCLTGEIIFERPNGGREDGRW